MKNYLKVFFILFLVSALILLIFKWTAVKNFLDRLRRPTGEAPSMIRALPFDVLQEKKKGRLPKLREKLTPTQILIEDIVANPKGAPIGKYVRVSVVVETWTKKDARALSAQKGKLATIVLETIQKFPYERLKTRHGLREFKEALSRRILFLYGDRVREVSLVEFEFREARR